MSIVELYSMTLTELFAYASRLLKDLVALAQTCETPSCRVARDHARDAIRDCNNAVGILRPYIRQPNHSAPIPSGFIRVSGGRIPAKTIAIESIVKALRAQSSAMLQMEYALLQRLEKEISRIKTELETVIPPPRQN